MLQRYKTKSVRPDFISYNLVFAYHKKPPNAYDLCYHGTFASVKQNRFFDGRKTAKGRKTKDMEDLTAILRI